MFARGRGGSTRGRGTGAEVGRAEAWPMSQAVVRKSQRAFSARPTNTPVGGPPPHLSHVQMSRLHFMLQTRPKVKSAFY